jgi:site-specific DNA-methyltransferase (adenine-specific)
METVEAWDCSPDCSVRLLDEQSGERSSGSRVPVCDQSTSEIYGGGKGLRLGGTNAFNGDTGGASRFFYTSKASRADRGKNNSHPTVKPTDLMRYLVRLVCPIGGIVLDPFNGSGATTYAARAESCKFIGIDISEEYCEIARARLAQGVLF